MSTEMSDKSNYSWNFKIKPDKIKNGRNHFWNQLHQQLDYLFSPTGMPDIELGVNDLVRQGKEVVGRHDIIPVVTEEWIRLEGVEFHSCVQQDEYEKGRTIK